MNKIQKAITLATLITAATALPSMAEIGEKIGGYFNLGTKPGKELVRTGVNYGDVSLKFNFQPGEEGQEDFKGYFQHPIFGPLDNVYIRYQDGDQTGNGRKVEAGADISVLGQYILPLWLRFDADSENGDLNPDSFFAMAEGSFPGWFGTTMNYGIAHDGDGAHGVEDVQAAHLGFNTEEFGFGVTNNYDNSYNADVSWSNGDLGSAVDFWSNGDEWRALGFVSQQPGGLISPAWPVINYQVFGRGEFAEDATHLTPTGCKGKGHSLKYVLGQDPIGDWSGTLEGGSPIGKGFTATVGSNLAEGNDPEYTTALTWSGDDFFTEISVSDILDTDNATVKAYGSMSF